MTETHIAVALGCAVVFFASMNLAARFRRWWAFHVWTLCLGIFVLQVWGSNWLGSWEHWWQPVVVFLLDLLGAAIFSPDQPAPRERPAHYVYDHEAASVEPIYMRNLLPPK